MAPGKGVVVAAGSMFDLTYDGSRCIWHRSIPVGASCLLFAVLGCPVFWSYGSVSMTALMLITSICSFYADYLHIEDPDHVAHQIDRVVANVTVVALSYNSLFLLGLSFAYCTFTLVTAVMLFLLSRSRKDQRAWALCHTLWHAVPLLMIFSPGLVGIQL
mmetsp:Transcript_88806/g.185634  ORF Transcript_88806/g.185634 Transcript_88806/m.185634 type:complete len:160 (+) Transcript_88806:251-730(+)